jgi:hypothetical protein
MKLLDTRFHRSGYPKTVNYTENDMPDRWPATWTRRGAYDTDFYIEQTHRQFTYTLNSQGYREQEWIDIDWNNSYIFLGCSHIYGVGVAIDETIPKLMQDRLSTCCVNLGIPGGNNYFSMVNSAKLINAGITPKGVFYQHTYPARWFTFKDDTLNTVNANDKGYEHYFKDAQYVDFLDSSITETLYSQWKDICPVIEFNIDNIIPDSNNNKYIARCGSHYNHVYHEKVVETLYNKYNKYNQQVEE